MKFYPEDSDQPAKKRIKDLKKEGKICLKEIDEVIKETNYRDTFKDFPKFKKMHLYMLSQGYIYHNVEQGYIHPVSKNFVDLAELKKDWWAYNFTKENRDKIDKEIKKYKLCFKLTGEPNKTIIKYKLKQMLESD